MGKFNDYPVRNHSVTLIHDHWPVDLDVHRVFPGFLRDASEVFEVLWNRRVEIISAHQAVDIPDFSSSALILALHSARSKAEHARHATELAYLIQLSTSWTEGQRADLAELARVTGSSQALADVLPLMGVSVSADDGASPADVQRWRRVIHGKTSSLQAWRTNLTEHPAHRWPGLVWHAIWPSEEFLRATSRIKPGETHLTRVRLRRLTGGAAGIGRAVRARLGLTPAETPVSEATQTMQGGSDGHAPLVSVVIPVYNTAPYLVECLETVLDQTHRNLEVICVDDGSVDHSTELLDRIALTDPRVRVIRQDHHGVGATRNVGIRAATGELLTFVDSDDLVAPTLVETLVDALGKADAVFSAWPGERRTVCGPEAIAPGIRLATLNTTGKLLRTVVQREHDILFDEGLKLREDIIFNTKYLLRAREVVLTPERLYQHRPRPGSLTTGFRPDKHRELAEADARLAELTRELHTPRFTSLLNYLRIRSFISAGLNLHHADSPLSHAESVKTLRTWQENSGPLPVRHGDVPMLVTGWLFRLLGPARATALAHGLKQFRGRLTR
ncbi:glycosyltransferase family 2 protein [Ammonicoccus fulvus]|uniref:Glycosyltransferase family 2 protein n=1 Tax=Ammonicoccus fulvus TaxID=3138240 RepID=A0ABZ3FM67_9ACTN